MKLLTFTTLYPDTTRPRHGIFVETRLRQLLARGALESTVVAPVPWFPSKRALFGKYAAYARVPREERRNGLRVLHPRYPLLPGVGMNLAPFGMAAATLGCLRRLIREGNEFDVIDAHYFYPDGVAAVILGQYLRKPVVISARGSDINLIPQYHVPRRLIRYAAARAAAVVAVSQALRERLLALGVDGDRISVLRNGVDTRVFYPTARPGPAERVGGVPLLLSVGNLVPLKGHDLVIAALTRLPRATLVIVGDGPERYRLEAAARRGGVHQRVRFVPEVPQEQLREYYSAADVLVLASAREGWPNVLLEAMACGTPVIATAVGGASEIVRAPEAGRLLTERTPECIAAAVEALLAHYPDRAATRRYVETFGWEEVVSAQHALYQSVIESHRLDAGT